MRQFAIKTRINKSEVFVAEKNKEVVGFAALKLVNATACLDFLFIKPDFLKQGVRQVLWQKCLHQLFEKGQDRLK